MSLFKILRGDSSRISTDTTPFHDGYAYYTSDDGGFYIDSETDGVQKRTRINEPAQLVSATLTSSGWSSGKQTVSVSGLSAAQNGYTSLAQNATAAQTTAARAAKLSVTGQAAGSITITAYGTVPTIDIPIAIVLLS